MPDRPIPKRYPKHIGFTAVFSDDFGLDGLLILPHYNCDYLFENIQKGDCCLVNFADWNLCALCEWVEIFQGGCTGISTFCLICFWFSASDHMKYSFLNMGNLIGVYYKNCHDTQPLFYSRAGNICVLRSYGSLKQKSIGDGLGYRLHDNMDIFVGILDIFLRFGTFVLINIKQFFIIFQECGTKICKIR